MSDEDKDRIFRNFQSGSSKGPSRPSQQSQSRQNERESAKNRAMSEVIHDYSTSQENDRVRKRRMTYTNLRSLHTMKRSKIKSWDDPEGSRYKNQPYRASQSSLQAPIIELPLPSWLQLNLQNILVVLILFLVLFLVIDLYSTSTPTKTPQAEREYNFNLPHTDLEQAKQRWDNWEENSGSQSAFPMNSEGGHANAYDANRYPSDVEYNSGQQQDNDSTVRNNRYLLQLDDEDPFENPSAVQPDERPSNPNYQPEQGWPSFTE